MDGEIVFRQLCIKAYHVSEVEESERFSLKQREDGSYLLSLNPAALSEFRKEEPLITDARLSILPPGKRHIPVNSIMDVIPISAKVLGRLGEGITHTLTGVYVVLTGADTEGNPISAFGNSDGMLDEHMIFGRAGTPGEDDIILLLDVTLKAMEGYHRTGPDAVHRLCDRFCQEIREKLKKLNPGKFTEKHSYQDIARPGKKKVALVKLVSGQGAMYDTRFLAKEPSAFLGGRSIIDITGAPMILSPNEYRDGAIRALY